MSIPDEDEDSIYDLIPRPVIKTDVVIFSKPLAVDSDESSSVSKSRECRSLTTSQRDTRSRENRTNKSRDLRETGSDEFKSRESRTKSGESRDCVTGAKNSSRSAALSRRSSSRFGADYPNDADQDDDPGKIESLRKRKLTRSSCVLELVDQRKSARIVPEVRAITTRSSSKTPLVTRSINRNSPRLSAHNLKGTAKRDTRGTRQKTKRVLRSSGPFTEGKATSSVKSSPGSVSSNSDRLLKKVHVPRSDRVLRVRGQRR